VRAEAATQGQKQDHAPHAGILADPEAGATGLDPYFRPIWHWRGIQRRRIEWPCGRRTAR
jgi:hypothetical protein